MESASVSLGVLVVSADGLLVGWIAGGSVVANNVELLMVVVVVLLNVLEVVDDDCGADADGSADSTFVGLVPTSAEAYSRLKRWGSWKSS